MHAHRPAALAKADRRNQAAEAGADDLRMAGLHGSARRRHYMHADDVLKRRIRRCQHVPHITRPAGKV
jgi:hypothetical protein